MGDSNSSSGEGSLRAIAEDAGVSRMTVSRILNGRGGHRAEVVRKVKEAAERVGYRINPHVAAAMEQVRRNRPAQYVESLAFFDLDIKSNRSSVHGERLKAGCERRALGLGYKIEHHNYPSKENEGRSTVRMLRARGIRGVILGSIGSRKVLRHLDLTGFACAASGISIVDPPLSRVVGEAADRVRLALEHCERQEYRRPVLAVDRSSFLTTRQHFIEPLLHWYYRMGGGGEDPLYLFDGRDGPREDFDDFLEQQHPDVVLSPRRSVFDWLRARKPYRRMAFVHLNWSKERSQGLAGASQQSEMQGEALIDLISACLHRGDFHPHPLPREVVIPPVWKPGRSLPRCRGRAAVKRIGVG